VAIAAAVTAVVMQLPAAAAAVVVQEPQLETLHLQAVMQKVQMLALLVPTG
jgi:hypothetical protein